MIWLLSCPLLLTYAIISKVKAGLGFGSAGIEDSGEEGGPVSVPGWRKTSVSPSTISLGTFPRLVARTTTSMKTSNGPMVAMVGTPLTAATPEAEKVM